MKRDVYQIVTDRIVSLLESGTIPWHKPWKGGNQVPQNFLTRKAYRGINLFLLHAARYISPFWLTWKQVHSIGGRIKKGEHSFPVVFWKILEDVEDGETKRIPFLRYYSVFNVEQCDGIALPPLVEGTPVPKFEPIAQCEKVVSDMPKRPTIVHGGGCASYSPLHDEVTMPKSDLFESSERYYSTLFHELIHATGHLSRLGRKEVCEPTHFGSDPYSREELVAEMGAAFLCGHCGIENQTIDQSAGYVSHWIRRLNDDRKLVIHAAAQAQKASDFILNAAPETDEGPNDPQPKEYKVISLRECPTPMSMQMCDTPQKAVEYWNSHIKTHPHFNPDCECFVVLLLNTRRRVKGHHLVSIGTLDQVIVHPREVFRTAVVATAGAVILMHNHPSGEPQPSEADIKVTRDLIRAGQIMKIEVLDHVILGNRSHCSLRELGYFL